MSSRLTKGNKSAALTMPTRQRNFNASGWTARGKARLELWPAGLSLMPARWRWPGRRLLRRPGTSPVTCALPGLPQSLQTRPPDRSSLLPAVQQFDFLPLGERLLQLLLVSVRLDIADEFQQQVGFVA